MILIADSGGTKVEWCLLNKKGEVKRFYTAGMNAMMLTAEELAQRVADEVVPVLGDYRIQVNKVYFYGAGCLPGKVSDNVRDAIAKSFTCEIEVASDLMGAARALCGRSAGIACILGTGSNSCYYDGRTIVKNISALGYVLGDEGSGAYMGKVLLGDVLKQQLPPDICEKFLKQYDLDAPKVIQRVYREPYAQRFLGSVTPFLKENLDHPAIYALVYNAFKAFFTRNVSLYHLALPVNFCGSIAYYYKDVLTKVAADLNYEVGVVIKAPMDGLVRYHIPETL